MAVDPRSLNYQQMQDYLRQQYGSIGSIGAQQKANPQWSADEMLRVSGAPQYIDYLSGASAPGVQLTGRGGARGAYDDWNRATAQDMRNPEMEGEGYGRLPDPTAYDYFEGAISPVADWADANGGSTYGSYYGIFNPDGTLRDVDFRKAERTSGGWIHNNLDTIGPLVVGGAAALGGGLFAGLGGAAEGAGTAGWTSGYDLAGGGALGGGGAGAGAGAAGWTSGYDLAAGGALGGGGAGGASLGAGAAPITASQISSLGPAATWGDIGLMAGQGGYGQALGSAAGKLLGGGAAGGTMNGWSTAVQLIGGLIGDNMMANAGKDQANAVRDAAASSTAISNRMLDMAGEQWEFGKNLISEYQPLYKRLIEADVGMAEDARARSNAQWTDYDQIFRPIEKRFAQESMTYDSPEEIARREGLAAGTVQTQFDAARDQTGRNMAAMGLSPDSGRSMQTGIDQGNMLALAKAGAVNKERNDTVLQGMSMRQAAANFGRNMPNTSIAQNQAALAGNTAASNTMGAATAQPGVALQPGTALAQGALSANNSAGSLNFGLLQNQQQTAANRASSLGSVLGLGLGQWPSDERSKKNVEDVSDADALAGIRMVPVKEWDYKPGEGDGGHHVGAMAQDLHAGMGGEVAPGGTQVDAISYVGKLHAGLRALDKKVSRILGAEDTDYSAMGLKPLRM